MNPINLVVPVYEKLKDLLREEIISGNLSGGERLTISEVAQKYNVSQMPVREAFQALAGEGLIEISPHRGARVLALNKKFVADIYDVRCVIEGLLARLSAPKIEESTIEKLIKINNDFIEARHLKDLQKCVLLDRKFHWLIFKNSDNLEAMKIYEKYSSLIMTLRHIYGYSEIRKPKSWEEHAKMLEAIIARQPAKLEKLSKAHSKHGKIDLLQLLEREEK